MTSGREQRPVGAELGILNAELWEDPDEPAGLEVEEVGLGVTLGVGRHRDYSAAGRVEDAERDRSSLRKRAQEPAAHTPHLRQFPRPS